MNYLLRLAKRVIVLIPGVLIAYFAVTQIYPSIDRLDRHSNDIFGILVTYILTAYILIPASSRLLRIIIKPKHIPLYCTTPDGFASDPVNVGVVGTREQLINSMNEAGWYQSDKRTPKNLFRLVMSVILRRPYNNAPFSALYLFGRSQDIGFELPISNNPAHRHHVRFWAVTYVTDPRYRDHVFFWQRHHKGETPDRVLWVGAASLDSGFGIIRHNAQITHTVHPNTNAERNLIIKSLRNTEKVASTRQITVGKPYTLKNRVLNATLQADGRVIIAELKTRNYARQTRS